MPTTRKTTPMRKKSPDRRGNSLLRVLAAACAVGLIVLVSVLMTGLLQPPNMDAIASMPSRNAGDHPGATDTGANALARTDDHPDPCCVRALWRAIRLRR